MFAKEAASKAKESPLDFSGGIEPTPAEAERPKGSLEFGELSEKLQQVKDEDEEIISLGGNLNILRDQSKKTKFDMKR